MSITSSNNLSVNNSLTVNGNTILNSDSTDTIIINGTSTVNNGLIINGAITQNSGTFSTSSDNVYLNGDITIANNKKLTTSTATTTINGMTQANNNIYVLAGKSLYIADTYVSKYLRNFHDGVNAYIDYITNLYFRYNGVTTALTLNSSGNMTTNGITCSSLSNSGSSSLASISCSSISNSGSYNGISCTSLSNSGSSTLASISCSSISNSGSYNGISCTSLTNSGSSSLNSVSCTNLTASNIIGVPSIELGPNGTSNFTYIDMKTYGSGTTLGGPQFDFDVRIGCTGGSTTSSGQGALTITCASATIGSNLTVNGNLTASSMTYNSINLGYSTLPTFTSSMVGYQSTLYPLTSAVNISTGADYSSIFSFTLPIGVWDINLVLVIGASAGNFTITQGKIALTNSSSTIIYQENLPQQYFANGTINYKHFNTIAQNSSSTTVTLSYTNQSYSYTSASNSMQIEGTTTINPSYVILTRIA